MNNFHSTINSVFPLDSFDRTRVHCHPNIPQELLQNAKNSFACTSYGERDIIFIDTSPRGFMQKLSSGNAFAKPGSTGLLITDRAIYDGTIWERDSFLPPMKKRVIPLELIKDIAISNWIDGKKRLMINGIPLFGENPPSFIGIENGTFLDWCLTQIKSLLSGFKGKIIPSVKDIVLSYQSFLYSESLILGQGDLYYAGHIPPAYVQSAKDVYLNLQAADEEILFFYNDGGKGKGGVVLTNRNLFSHAYGHDFFFKWPLNTINSVWIGDTKSWNTTYLYVIVNEQRVFGWPNTVRSQSSGRNYRGILRPTFSLAALICQAVSVIGGPRLPIPTTITDLMGSGVNFRISEGQN